MKSPAQNVLNELEKSSSPKFVSPWEFALVYDALGDKSQALTFLEKAADQHAGWVAMIAVDPRLDNLHADPRFKRLERRIRIPHAANNPAS